MSAPYGNLQNNRTSSSASPLRSGFLRLAAQVTRRFRPPGMERLLRLFCNPDGPSYTHFQCLAPYGGNFLIHVDTSSFLEWSVFFFGHYEPEVVRHIQRYLPTGGVALDVGANVGLMTLVMAKATGTGGRVIAVEPNPRVFERLSQNLQLNRVERITLYPCALGAGPGKATLHCPVANSVNQGCATFASKTQAPLSEDLEVSVQTLDQIVKQEQLLRLDLVKIDTEGWDFFVLKGGARTIESFRPVILFEFMKPGWTEAGVRLEEAAEWLRCLHYRLWAIQGRRLVPLRNVRVDCFNILALPTLSDQSKPSPR